MFAVQNMYFMPRFKQFADQQFADKVRPADNEDPLVGRLFESLGVLLLAAGTIHRLVTVLRS